MDRILQQLPEFFSPMNTWFLVEAMGLTLALTGIGCGFGFLLAFFVVYVRQTPGYWALPFRAVAILFVESMRRIPFLVTIYLVLFFIVIFTNNPSLFMIALIAICIYATLANAGDALVSHQCGDFAGPDIKQFADKGRIEDEIVTVAFDIRSRFES